MRLVLKPVGPGNWKAMVIEYSGPQLPPPIVLMGQKIPFGGRFWRVVRVVS